MDHIPVPWHAPGGNQSKLIFPCVCDPNGFDNGPLETYPERKGFRLNFWGDLKFANILTLPNGSRPCVEQCTILLQEWLFFGLLQAIHSIYGSEFEGNDYVTGSGQGRVLTLEKLPQHVAIWSRLEASRPNPVRQQHFREIDAHLMRAIRFLTNNFTDQIYGSADITRSGAHEVHEESRIALEFNLEILLVILVEAVEIANRLIYFRKRLYWDGEFEDICLSTRRLLENLPWCPSEFNIVSLTFNNGTSCFATSISRAGAEARHSQCTSTKCLAFQLEEFNYQTAHTTVCQGCGELRINPTELQRILEDNDRNTNPRVKITITDNDEVKISVTDEGQYVAISHVWSDGLGHPPGVNSLPECQLRRLRYLVQQTGLKEPIVWIDSLCVPAKVGPAKRNALAQMASVYRDARNVLVFDADLLSTPSSRCNEELLMRIALSHWMRRLWTLEEGIIARPRLLFQFSDRSIPLPEPHESSTDSVALNCAALISRYLPANTDIMSVITALHFRSTSWAADEPLCVSYILDLNALSILKINRVRHDLRMVELFHQLAKKDPIFPSQFLFTDEKKLDISPFRWAPMSFLSIEPHDVGFLRRKDNDIDFTATQTERGLQLQAKQYLSCLLSFDEGANIKKCMIIRIDALSYVLCPVPKNGKCRSHMRFWEGADRQLRLNSDPSQDWTETWQANYGFRPTGNWGLIYDRGCSYGVMVAIDEAKGGPIYATYVGQVHMYELRTSHASIVAGLNKEYWGQLGHPMLDEEEVRQDQERVESSIFDEGCYSRVNCVVRLPENVTWCVG